MIGLTFTTFMLMQIPEFIDSKDNPEITYVVIGDCSVPVKKQDVKDNQDEVVKRVMEICK